MSNDKIVLASGTEILLASSMGLGALQITADSIAAACKTWEEFTKENLAQVTVKNADDVTVGTYEDLKLDHVTGAPNPDGTVSMTFSLRKKTNEEILLEKVTLLEAGQQIHDEALCDLGQAVSDIMEGGTV